jgi:hypothetical protein
MGYVQLPDGRLLQVLTAKVRPKMLASANMVTQVLAGIQLSNGGGRPKHVVVHAKEVVKGIVSQKMALSIRGRCSSVYEG